MLERTAAILAVTTHAGTEDPYRRHRLEAIMLLLDFVERLEAEEAARIEQERKEVIAA